MAKAAAIPRAASAPTPRPVCADSLPCRSSSERRSGSLSAMIAACASRADTRPCRLPRMAPACVRVCSYSFISASRRSRVCGSLEPARRSSGLPSSRPCAISLNEFKSLPSRNTASGDTPSIVRNSLADLPMRCVSITSWPAAEISAGARVLLQLERRHRLGDFQQVGRLAVDGAQGVAHLRQDLLLAHHGAGVLFGALHQGRDLLDVFLQLGLHRLQAQRVVAGLQAAHRLGQHVRRFPSRRGTPARCPPAPATRTSQGAATASATGRYRPPAGRPCRPGSPRRTPPSPAPPAQGPAT